MTRLSRAVGDLLFRAWDGWERRFGEAAPLASADDDETEADLADEGAPLDPDRAWFEAATVLGLPVHEGGVPACYDAEAIRRRWSVLRPALIAGDIECDEARAMLVPEVGEAWARVVYASAGVADGGFEDCAAMASRVGFAAAEGLRAERLIDAETWPEGGNDE